MRSEDRTLAVVMWILCIPFPFLAPFLFLFFTQNRPLVFNNSVQALGFTAFLLILDLVILVLKVFTFGLAGLFFIIPAILHIVIPIMGAISASNGRIFEPLVSGPIVKSLMSR